MLGYVESIDLKEEAVGGILRAAHLMGTDKNVYQSWSNTSAELVTYDQDDPAWHSPDSVWLKILSSEF